MTLFEAMGGQCSHSERIMVKPYSSLARRAGSLRERNLVTVESEIFNTTTVVPGLPVKFHDSNELTPIGEVTTSIIPVGEVSVSSVREVTVNAVEVPVNAINVNAVTSVGEVTSRKETDAVSAPQFKSRLVSLVVTYFLEFFITWSKVGSIGVDM